MNTEYNIKNTQMRKRATFMAIANRQSGFTLIELMISLVLGLLIAAAAMQVYIINFKTTTVQQSTSELQDASIFGLQLLESHMRLANLGNVVTEITDETLGGGIVLSGLNIGKFTYDTDNKKVNSYTGMGNLTRSIGDTAGTGNRWTGVSNVNDDSGGSIVSDQLTIQFQNITDAPIADCEGNDIAIPIRDGNDVVTKPGEIAIERYFLRQATGSSLAGDTVLACDAGRMVLTDTTIQDGKGKDITVKTYNISDFGDTGQTFINGVDQFKVLLGTQTTENSFINSNINKIGQMMYLPSSAYNRMEVKEAKRESKDSFTKVDHIIEKPPIVSVKIGMVLRGNTSVLGDENQTKFSVLGQDSVVAQDNKMRTTYETTVLLRNARVIDIVD